MKLPDDMLPPGFRRRFSRVRSSLSSYTPHTPATNTVSLRTLTLFCCKNFRVTHEANSRVLSYSRTSFQNKKTRETRGRLPTASVRLVSRASRRGVLKGGFGSRSLALTDSLAVSLSLARAQATATGADMSIEPRRA